MKTAVWSNWVQKVPNTRQVLRNHASFSQNGPTAFGSTKMPRLPPRTPRQQGARDLTVTSCRRRGSLQRANRIHAHTDRETERERERDIYICRVLLHPKKKKIYIYIYICIYIPGPGDPTPPMVWSPPSPVQTSEKCRNPRNCRCFIDASKLPSF